MHIILIEIDSFLPGTTKPVSVWVNAFSPYTDKRPVFIDSYDAAAEITKQLSKDHPYRRFRVVTVSERWAEIMTKESPEDAANQ